MHVTNTTRRHDYKFGFRRPYKLGDVIPDWDVFVDARVPRVPDFVRLSTSEVNSEGAIWSNRKNPHQYWEAVFSFHIQGHGAVGSDGLAFWYTQDRGHAGPLYGNEDPFKGLGIIFHTYDETEKKSSPYIMAFTNDGHVKLHDAENINDHMKGSCLRDVRGTLHDVFAKVTYHKRTLSLNIDTSGQGHEYKPCFVAHDVDLPSGYYFGVSAASGHLPDTHDVKTFDLYQLDPPPKVITDHREVYHMDETQRHQAEEVHHKMEELHHKETERIEEDEYGGAELHALMSLEENQSHIMDAIHALHSKLDMMGVHGAQPTGVHGQGGAVHGPASEEIRDDVKRLGRELSAIKTIVDRMALVHSTAGSDSSSINDMLIKMDHVQHRLDEIAAGRHIDYTEFHRVASSHVASTHSTITWVAMLIAIPALCFVLYSFYKKRQGTPKKYF
ncbi:hypothetical protein H4R34_004924 [Dimargaris verticillata]|uniref:L-type lectin-like domain-containing protein n=1 Tax=Dimargaris verticillata TaxID=2761393 RepID=A0A9W8B3C4_9FUNG|nr:hypothetical protein H4R34_004924 [Dimargaris verticillata]